MENGKVVCVANSCDDGKVRIAIWAGDDTNDTERYVLQAAYRTAGYTTSGNSHMPPIDNRGKGYSTSTSVLRDFHPLEAAEGMNKMMQVGLEALGKFASDCLLADEIAHQLSAPMRATQAEAKLAKLEKETEERIAKIIKSTIDDTMALVNNKLSGWIYGKAAKRIINQ